MTQVIEGSWRETDTKEYQTGREVSSEELRFFEYDQNNSKGSFDYNENAGISVTIFVQASSAGEANSIARSIGLYFDGEGDCGCCGSRWHEASSWSSDYGSEGLEAYLEDYVTSPYFHKWMEDGKPEVFIHYLDGRIVGRIHHSLGKEPKELEN